MDSAGGEFPQYGLRGFAGGFGFAPRRGVRFYPGLATRRPVIRQAVFQTTGELGGEFRVRLLVGGIAGIPLRFGLFALLASIPFAAHIFRHFKRRMRPVELFAQGGDGWLPQRAAMAFRGSGFSTRRIADLGATAD